MKKFLFLLAFIATPAFAEPIAPGPNATFEQRLAYVRALRIQNEQVDQKVIDNNQATINKLNDENTEMEKKYGYIPSRPSWYFHSRVYVPTYVPTRRVICTRYGCQ